MLADEDNPLPLCESSSVDKPLDVKQRYALNAPVQQASDAAAPGLTISIARLDCYNNEVNDINCWLTSTFECLQMVNWKNAILE